MALTLQITSNKSGTCSGLSALIQAAASQHIDLGENTNALKTSQTYSDRDSVSSLLTSSSNQGGVSVGTVSFPEVLMHLLQNQANENIITFLPDGKYFAIRRIEFTDLLLYKFFHLIDFNHFLELIVKWGFVRVDRNNIKNADNNTDKNNSNNTVDGNHNDIKTEIYVFRHMFFDMNQPLDLSKIKFRGTKKDFPQSIKNCSSDESTSTDVSSPPPSSPMNVHSKTITNVKNYKRQSFPSQVERHSNGYHQTRLASEKISTSTAVLDQICLPSSNCFVQQTQISTIDKARSDRITDKNINNICQSLKEDLRRHSTLSTLVEGGVEAATQNIVTDAIEALLFDESHTRRTFMRHEKELSVSSLPGVIPISKQLFSENIFKKKNKPLGNTNNDSGNKKSKSFCDAKGDTRCSTSSCSQSRNKRKSNDRRKRKYSSSLSNFRPSLEINTTCAFNSSLEDASRCNHESTNNTDHERCLSPNLRVIVPNNDSLSQRRRYITSMVVSPTRMEAAALLVSQSRIRHYE